MKNIVISVAISICGSILAIYLYQHFYIQNNKIGFVKTGVILNEYSGMKELNERLNEELKIVSGNVDTLYKRFEKLNNQKTTIASSKYKEWEYKTQLAEKEYLSYNERANQEMQKRQLELTNKIILEINQFVEKYAVVNGYKYIFGATTDGSIMYGQPEEDLTESILNQMNENFKNKKTDNATNQEK